MCDEVIFRDRYLHTVEDLQIALEGGESDWRVCSEVVVDSLRQQQAHGNYPQGT